MINVRRLTVIVFLGAGLLPGISAQESSVQTAAQSEMNLPAQWDLQSCIDYALQQNITTVSYTHLTLPTTSRV